MYYDELEDKALKAYHREPLTKSDWKLFENELDIQALGEGQRKLKYPKDEDDEMYEGGQSKSKQSLCARICNKGSKDDANKDHVPQDWNSMSQE